MANQLIKFSSLTVILILVFSSKLRGQNVQIMRESFNSIITNAWNIDSCGSLGLRRSFAFFMYESKYLLNQTIDSVISLLGNPDYDQGISAGEHVWSYCTSCLEDDKLNCIKDGEACLGIIKIWINVKSKRVSLVSIKNG